MKRVLILLLTLFFITSCSKADDPLLSGEILGGLRTITVDNEKSLNFRVYRGDYIIFDITESSMRDVKIPKLEIETTFPRPDGERAYIKMKTTGSYDIQFGDKKGVIEVIEYSGANYKELSAKDAAELITHLNPFILDVRTQGEYNAEHLENAGLLPVQLLEDNLDKLKQFKDEPILIYCASGNRSTVAAKILIDKGFSSIYNLRFGFGDWKRKGYETVR